MIDRLRLERFKCFDTLDLELGPLTLLLGPNSSGKSSILQSMLLMKQTAPTFADLAVLQTLGPVVDLGWFGNIVHTQQALPAEPDITLGFGWGTHFVKFAYSAQDWLEREATLPQLGVLDHLEVALPNGIIGRWSQGTVGATERGGEARLALVADEAMTRFLTGRMSDTGYTGAVRETSATLERLRRGDGAIRIEVAGDRILEVSVELPKRCTDDDTDPQRPSIDAELHELLLEAVATHAYRELTALRTSLAAARWLGPLRAPGRRFYPYAPDERTRLAPDGDNLPVVLSGANIAQIDEWMGMLELPYSLDVRCHGVTGLTTEVLLQRSTPPHHTVGIPDVGTGIAQVLPLLAHCADASTSANDDLLLLQQPELHLHPRQQGLLAEVFCDTVRRRTSARNQLIIETHSETLVLHLQHLVATEQLQPEDVCILASSVDHHGRIGVSRIPLEEDGSLSEPWPGGFFPDAAILRRRLR